MAKTKEPSQRQLRVGEEIRHILADIFARGDFDEAKLRGTSITVTEVDVAPDMRQAVAYISPLSGIGSGALVESDIIDELNTQAHIFNRALAKKLVMKFSPRIRFSSDKRFDYAERIENLLHKAKQAESDE